MGPVLGPVVQGVRGSGVRGGFCMWHFGHPPGVGWRGEGPFSMTSFRPVHGVRGFLLCCDDMPRHNTTRPA